MKAETQGECHVTAKAGAGVQAKKHQRLLANYTKLSRGKEELTPYEFRRESSLVDALISDFG